jgi:integrase
MFAADEILAILDAADAPMRAMVLLGINAAFGNNDCGMLTKSVIDLKKEWVNFPRPKTSVQRRCPLWPETVAALKIAIDERPEPKSGEHNGLIFLTKYGQPWARDSKASPLSAEFRKLLQKIDRDAEKDAAEQGIKPPAKLFRPGHGFYTLRRTFRTVASEALDEPAADVVMGHAEASDDMAAIYRQQVSDERLKRIVTYVHDWLYPRPTAK